MNHIKSTIARLYPFEQTLTFEGVEFNGPQIESFVARPEVEAMFVFIANARNLLMFDAALFDAEVMGGNAPHVNWLNKQAIPAPSDYAPVLLDVWESDIGLASQKTATHIDVTACVNEWRQLASSQPQLLDPVFMVDALEQIELENSELKSLSQNNGQLAASIGQILAVRKNIESPAPSAPSPSVDRQPGS